MAVLADEGALYDSRAYMRYATRIIDKAHGAEDLQLARQYIECASRSLDKAIQAQTLSEMAYEVKASSERRALNMRHGIEYRSTDSD